ncbi:MAG: tRNA epoxyqueuosine(34) reductase QueG [Anaerohalosphaeraceae bacterium]|nr:tRNA epoxyqueuosine(34) reductase QueG [Anaerohalosphaeraceae bacterium]
MKSKEQQIKDKAISLGFDIVGITTTEPICDTDCKLLRQWLNAGLFGSMEYMNRNFEIRINPATLLEGAKSVICVGLNYKSEKSDSKTQCPISDYALYENYNPFMKQRLFALADFLKEQFSPNLKAKACVGSVPLAERHLAARAGLGFIGKNHMLINPHIGPKILLGELITDLPLEEDEPTKLNCYNCNKCIKACPTGALSADGNFDARKCISYLTIEHKGDITEELKPKIGNSLFGCDRCVLACPYSNKAPLCANKNFKFFPERRDVKPQDITNWSQEDFDKLFAGSALERTGLDKLKRNAEICLENEKL